MPEGAIEGVEAQPLTIAMLALKRTGIRSSLTRYPRSHTTCAGSRFCGANGASGLSLSVSTFSFKSGVAFGRVSDRDIVFALQTLASSQPEANPAA